MHLIVANCGLLGNKVFKTVKCSRKSVVGGEGGLRRETRREPLPFLLTFEVSIVRHQEDRKQDDTRQQARPPSTLGGGGVLAAQRNTRWLSVYRSGLYDHCKQIRFSLAVNPAAL